MADLRDQGADRLIKPKLPPYREVRVNADYLQLVRWADQTLVGKESTTINRTAVARKIALSLRLNPAAWPAVEMSLGCLDNPKILEISDLDDTLWRLAVNRVAVGKGEAFVSKPSYVTEHWARVEIENVINLATDNRKYEQVGIRVFIVDGPLAGHRYVAKVSRKSIYAVIRHLTEKIRGVFTSTPLVAVGLVAAMHLEVKDSQISHNHVSKTPSQLKFNIALMKSRTRKYQPCPYGALHDCNLCSVGRNECSRSVQDKVTHKITHGIEKT